MTKINEENFGIIAKRLKEIGDVCTRQTIYAESEYVPIKERIANAQIALEYLEEYYQDIKDKCADDTDTVIFEG